MMKNKNVLFYCLLLLFFFSSIVRPLSVFAADFTFFVKEGSDSFDDSSVSNADSESDVQDSEHREIESYFAILFLDVGQSDAAIVLCDHHAMMIDGGASNDSSLIYSILEDLGIEGIDALIATHFHDDHAGGLAAALAHSSVDHFFCNAPDYDSLAFDKIRKQAAAQELELEVPHPGDTLELGSALVTFLSLNNELSINNNSIIVRIEYDETSFLFMADAEYDEEELLIKSDFDLGSTLLKVGHHGSSTSTSKRFLQEVAPQYAVISVGADNPYGHPEQTVLDLFSETQTEIYRTDLCGHILCISDGKELFFETERELEIPHEEQNAEFTGGTPEVNAVAADCSYVLNRNTMKFHHPYCRSVDQMKETNKVYFTGTREEALSRGYVPCKNCNP